jgi:hypothetical protein
VQGALSAGVMLVLALWISATVEKRVLNQTLHDLSLRKVATNIVRSVLLVVGLLFALSAVGVDITALSVLGGAIGVGLGFGLQKLAANYVSGFVILFERSIRIGDTVKVDSFEGVVTDIKTRYTLIRGGNGREAIIPNEKMITERVENLSLADTRLLLTSDVTVGYASDPDQVQQILCGAALACEAVLRTPQPVAHLTRLGADGLEFSLNYWIDHLANGPPACALDGQLQCAQGFARREHRDSPSAAGGAPEAGTAGPYFISDGNHRLSCGKAIRTAQHADHDQHEGPAAAEDLAQAHFRQQGVEHEQVHAHRRGNQPDLHDHHDQHAEPDRIEPQPVTMGKNSGMVSSTMVSSSITVPSTT